MTSSRVRAPAGAAPRDDACHDGDVELGNAPLAELSPQRVPGVEFGNAHVSVVAVRQDEEVEVIEGLRPRDRLDRRAQAGEDAPHVLVADRHDHSRARVGRQRPRRDRGTRDQVAVSAPEQDDKTHHGGPETGSQPA